MTERIIYGCRETMPLGECGGAYHAQWKDARHVDWTHPGLRITRLRLLSDPGYRWWDISYCHGVLPNGEKVYVNLPMPELPKKNLFGVILEWAKKDGVYAKGLGIFDAISTVN